MQRYSARSYPDLTGGVNSPRLMNPITRDSSNRIWSRNGLILWIVGVVTLAVVQVYHGYILQNGYGRYGYEGSEGGRHLRIEFQQPSAKVESKEKTPVDWPIKLGTCSPRGWPSQLMLVSDGYPVQMQAIEVEKTNDGKLTVLVSAVSEEEGVTTSELLQKAVSDFRCDFRKGNVALNSRFAPLHRSRVELSLIQEDEVNGYVAAKVACDLPPASVLDGHKSLLPDFVKVQELEEQERVRAEKNEWLHWQLSLQSTAKEDQQSWLTAPSLSLCDTSSIQSTENSWYSEWIGPNADEYGSREKEPEVGGWTSVALCVAPSPFTESLESWTNSSILEWLYYQQSILGFASVFYLDPFGEELLAKHPEISRSFGSRLVHVPHTSFHMRQASLMQEGEVAESLILERCAILARQRYVSYILVVEDPMDLIVPEQRRKFQLPAVLSNVTQDGCAQKLHLTKNIPWSIKNDSTRDSGCRGEWCSLPDAVDPVSQFLLGGRPLPSQGHEMAERHVFHSTLEPQDKQYCRESVSIPDKLMSIATGRGVRKASGNLNVAQTKLPSDDEESVRRLLTDVGSWTKHILQTSLHSRKKILLNRQKGYSNSGWTPLSANEAMRMCRPPDDTGPTYGEAIVLQPGKSLPLDESRFEETLRLTFFGAERTNSSLDGHPVLSLSVYAEDRDSIDMSLHSGTSWGPLRSSKNAPDILPQVDCVFSHPDYAERVMGSPRELRTAGKWRWLWPIEMDWLLWLDCPLPTELPLPDVWGLTSLVSITATGPLAANKELHMTHPVPLCIGAEKKRDDAAKDSQSCDDISVACNVGCIDDNKEMFDPQAQCCNRCREPNDLYQRFDERDFWTPVDQAAESPSTKSQFPLSTHTSVKGGDLSICLKPLFLETMCRDCDGMDAFSPEKLIEWIEYHLLVGFDVIYVLDRYTDSLLPLLERYVAAGRVIHVPFPLLTDASLSLAGRSNQTRLEQYFQDQVMAYDYCLSMGRRRNDAFVAYIDLDEFIRFPNQKAGGIRAAIGDVLKNENWSSQGSTLPDSIVLDRHDIAREQEGFALRYTTRNLDPRLRSNGSRVGKVLARPQALSYGAVTVHDAFDMNHSDAGAVVAPMEKLSVFHYRYKGGYQGKKAEDNSLNWAYQILSTQFVGTAGFKALYSLSSQGVLRLGRDRIRDKSKGVSLQDRKKPSLFIGILSYCSARDRRDAVRQTWLSPEALKRTQSSIKIQWRFVMGQTPAGEKDERCRAKALAREAAETGDLLLLDDLPESYTGITRKTLAMFKWADENAGADFVFKTDDDSYVDLSAIAASLIQVESPELPFYWGKHQKLSPWLAASYEGAPKWYMKPEDYPIDTQTYSTGAGYILSRPLVSRLAEQFQNHGVGDLIVPFGPEERLGWLEDVTVGYLLRGAVNRAGRVYSHGIHDAWWQLVCQTDFDYYVIHHLQAAHQLEIHNILQSKDGSLTGVCERLNTFKLDMPGPNAKERAQVTKWGGPLRDRPLSSLLTGLPASMATPTASSAIEKVVPRPSGRDVIVVTGGLHNIGRHLVETMLQGHLRMSGPITVLVVDSASVPRGLDGELLFSSSSNNSVPRNVNVESVQVDITDLKALKKTLSIYSGRIRGVVHLAAVSRVQDCHANREKCEKVNVEGTNNILSVLWSLYGRAAVDKMSAYNPQPLPWLVFASSREVYGALPPNGVAKEKSPLRPLNIYGETKLRAEKAVRQWALKTGFNAVVPRFTNVYGSCYDHDSRLVPNLVSRLISGGEFNIMGTAQKTISLLHVDDAVNALLLSISFAERLDNGAGYYEPFNIGGGPSHDALGIEDIVRVAQSSIRKLVSGCKSCRGSPRILSEKETSDRSPEPEHFRSSIEKAFNVLGYQPSRTYNETVLREYMESCQLVNDPRSGKV